MAARKRKRVHARRNPSSKLTEIPDEMMLVDLDEGSPSDEFRLEEREERRSAARVEEARSALRVPKQMGCEGCGEDKPVEEFRKYLAAAGDLDAEEAPAQLCDYCATYGPPLMDPFHQLTPRELRTLEHLAAGGGIRAAAQIMRTSPNQLRRMMRGEDKPLFRAAYRRLLVSQGLTPQALAKVLADALSATKHQWNSVTDSFQEFPDHGSRLKAAAHVQKVLQLDEPSELANREDKGPSVQFNFVTNLDGKSEMKDPGYTIIEAEVEER